LYFVLVLMVLLAPLASAQGNVPGAEWETIGNPGEAGWSAGKLERVLQYADTMDTAGGLVVYDGRILCDWGDIATKGNLHSARKSLMSALYGIYVNEGKIDLNSTMGELGIDDNEPGLTEEEKQARIIDLLKARSGVYHEAAYETDEMEEKRPERGSHAPDTFWYYNNWDFNTLGAIFEQLTGEKIGGAFYNRIAVPLEMQDFEAEDVSYRDSKKSDIPAYLFHLTARDMARFGLLYLRNGEWRGEQVIPSEWIDESTKSYSDAGPGVGYGYLWWVAKGHLFGSKIKGAAYSARGHGGQYIVVIPSRNLVVAYLSNYDESGINSNESFRGLMKLILEDESD
jgi:CubicO group peptidase (beta-lactamase class C family)